MELRNDDSIPFDLDRVCRVCRPLWPYMKQAGDFLPGPGLFPFPLCFRPLWAFFLSCLLLLLLLLLVVFVFLF
jgi:hypothetical protein